MTKLIVTTQLEYLHKKLEWPAEIMNFDVDSDELQCCINYGVFDIDKGLMLKIGEEKEVLAALKGRRQLSGVEIQAEYGYPIPKLEAIDWPTLNSFAQKAPKVNFWTFPTFFEACKAPLVMMGVEMID